MRYSAILWHLALNADYRSKDPEKGSTSNSGTFRYRARRETCLSSRSLTRFSIRVWDGKNLTWLTLGKCDPRPRRRVEIARRLWRMNEFQRQRFREITIPLDAESRRKPRVCWNSANSARMLGPRGSHRERVRLGALIPLRHVWFACRRSAECRVHRRSMISISAH